MALENSPLESEELCRLIRLLGERAERAVHQRDAPGELQALIAQWRCSPSKAASPVPGDRTWHGLPKSNRHAQPPCRVLWDESRVRADGRYATLRRPDGAAHRPYPC